MPNHGISSLVEVMFLIAMTVSLITLLFVWGTNLLGTTEEYSEDEFVSLSQLTNIKLTVTDAKAYISALSSVIEPIDIQIRNDNDQTIESFIVHMITISGEKRLVTNNLTADIKPLEEKTLSFVIEYPSTNDREYIELIPRINGKVVNYKLKVTPVLTLEP